jgi:hypothetical protein
MYTVQVSGTDPFHIYLGGSGYTNFTVSLSKNGGTFNTVSPSITDRNNGYYKIEPIAAHRDTFGENAWLFSPSGASPIPRVEQVVGYDYKNIPDQVLTRGVSNVEATCAEHSLATVVLAMLEHRIVEESGKLVIYRTNGTTIHLQKDIYFDDNARPMIAVD